MPTNSPGSVAREVHGLQVVHTIRFTVNYNDAGIAAGVGKQWLPAGAVIVGTDVVIATAFNAGTTNVLTVGTNAASYNNIVAGGAAPENAVALTNGIKPSGAALGPLANDVQVFATYNQTGTAATAGKAHVVVRYAPNNDPNM